MKFLKFKLIGFMLILLSCDANEKLAYVNRSLVVNEYARKISIEQRFQEKNTEFIKKRDSLIRQYESERQAASLRVQSMTKEQVQQLSLEFQQKEALIGEQIRAEQQELQQAFDAEMDSVIQEVKDYVVKYGETHKYAFIFGTSDATNTVMYGTNTRDISQIILDQLNGEYLKKRKN